MIWGSILGIVPFALVLPYANSPVTIALSAVIGLVLASAFSAIVVYAQELMPHRIGMVSGLFFGLAFGMGGLGAAVLGVLADCDQRRLRLQGLRVPAADRHSGGLSAGNEVAGRFRARQADKP